ncbi:hypothetical protein [Adhaeribacter aquaticus]|uniref:hypothetical protein n=1 Tax=Adhaeribacter aquaticus TaxID=299567 RepID=UPI00041D7A2E|nr:hypothetical protein [Adhaeribacter aquaticus]
MAPVKKILTSLQFPNSELMVTYSDVLRYVQYRLKILGHGQLKAFCQKFSFPYNSVVNLKNGTLKRKEHWLLQRILATLSFETSALQNPLATGDMDRYYYLFPGQSELQQFKEQLAIIDKQVPIFPS